MNRLAIQSVFSTCVLLLAPVFVKGEDDVSLKIPAISPTPIAFDFPAGGGVLSSASSTFSFYVGFEPKRLAASDQSDQTDSSSNRESEYQQLQSRLSELILAQQTETENDPFGSDRSSLDQEIEQLSESIWETEQKLLREEIDNLRSRLNAIEKKYQQREERRKEILERRVRELKVRQTDNKNQKVPADLTSTIVPAEFLENEYRFDERLHQLEQERKALEANLNELAKRSQGGIEKWRAQYEKDIQRIDDEIEFRKGQIKWELEREFARRNSQAPDQSNVAIEQKSSGNSSATPLILTDEMLEEEYQFDVELRALEKEKAGLLEQRKVLKSSSEKIQLNRDLSRVLKDIEFRKAVIKRAWESEFAKRSNQHAGQIPPWQRTKPPTFPFHFRNAPWKDVLRSLSDSAGLTLEVDDFPSETVSLESPEELSIDQAIELLNEKLTQQGFELWSTKDVLKLAKHLPIEHPLLGEWEFEVFEEYGTNSLRQPEIITFLPDRYLWDAKYNKLDHPPRKFSVSGNKIDLLNITNATGIANETEEILLRGVFQVDEDTLLIGMQSGGRRSGMRPTMEELLDDDHRQMTFWKLVKTRSGNRSFQNAPAQSSLLSPTADQAVVKQHLKSATVSWSTDDVNFIPRLGTIIGSEGGEALIVSSAYDSDELTSETKIQVQVLDEGQVKTYPGKLIEHDEYLELCLISIETDTPMSAVPFARELVGLKDDQLLLTPMMDSQGIPNIIPVRRELGEFPNLHRIVTTGDLDLKHIGCGLFTETGTLVGIHVSIDLQNRREIYVPSRQITKILEQAQWKLPTKSVFDKQADESARTPSKSALGEVIKDAQQPPSFKFRFNFQHAPWKYVLQSLSEAVGLRLDVDEFPAGTYSFQGDREYAVPEVIDVINETLKERGYEIWKLDDKLKLAKHLPEDHPLLGEWKVEEIIRDGKQTFKQGSFRFFRDQLHSLMEFARNRTNEKHRIHVSGNKIELFNEKDSGFELVRGSYQIDGDELWLSLELVEDAESMSEDADQQQRGAQTQVMKLKRINADGKPLPADLSANDPTSPEATQDAPSYPTYSGSSGNQNKPSAAADKSEDDDKPASASTGNPLGLEQELLKLEKVRAEEALWKANESLKSTTEQVKKGYRTQNDIEKARLAVIDAEIALKRAEMSLIHAENQATARELEREILQLELENATERLLSAEQNRQFTLDQVKKGYRNRDDLIMAEREMAEARVALKQAELKLKQFDANSGANSRLTPSTSTSVPSVDRKLLALDIEQAESELSGVQAEYERAKKLSEKGVSTQAGLLEAQAKLKQAEYKLQRAQLMLEKFDAEQKARKVDPSTSDKEPAGSYPGASNPLEPSTRSAWPETSATQAIDRQLLELELKAAENEYRRAESELIGVQRLSEKGVISTTEVASAGARFNAVQIDLERARLVLKRFDAQLETQERQQTAEARRRFAQNLSQMEDSAVFKTAQKSGLYGFVDTSKGLKLRFADPIAAKDIPSSLTSDTYFVRIFRPIEQGPATVGSVDIEKIRTETGEEWFLQGIITNGTGLSPPIDGDIWMAFKNR